jgi:integrase
MTRKWIPDSKQPGLAINVSGAHKAFHFRYGPQFRNSIKIGDCDDWGLKDARAKAREYRQIVDAGGDPHAMKKQLQDVPTLKKLSELYMQLHAKPEKKSWQNDDGYWRNHILSSPFGRKRLHQITLLDVATWHRTHAKPVTANRCLEVLSKAFKLARDWDLIAANPCQGIKKHRERQRRRYATPGEVQQLGQVLDRWLSAGGFDFRFACLIQLLLFTGARLREVSEARWRDVDLAQGVLTPVTHKSAHIGQDRQIILGRDALAVIERLLKHEAPGYWLVRGQGDNPLRGYRRPWLRMCEEAQLGDLRVHDLRHSFASYVLSSGHTLGVVGSLLGHASTQSTKRYAHLLTDAGRAAIDQTFTAAPEATAQSPSSGTNVLPFPRLG